MESVIGAGVSSWPCRSFKLSDNLREAFAPGRSKWRMSASPPPFAVLAYEWRGAGGDCRRNASSETRQRRSRPNLQVAGRSRLAELIAWRQNISANLT
jgi:hypothetical protein